MKDVSYKYALLGSVFYPLQHVIFYLRFGRWNTVLRPMDLMLPLTGVLATALLIKFVNATPSKQGRNVLVATFIAVCVPLTIVGSVGGGLLGPVGSLVFGLIPTTLALLIANAMVKLIWEKNPST